MGPDTSGHSIDPPAPPPKASVTARSDITETDWLSVAEAAAYCTAKGLSRNIKTVRRWAYRSVSHPETAEVLAARQDTDIDFRYVIERKSLDTKIAQELEFEAKAKRSDMSGHDRTSPDKPDESLAQNSLGLRQRAAADTPAHDQVGEDMSDKNEAQKSAVAQQKNLPIENNTGNDGGFLKDQLAEKDRQIGKLHKQLERRDEQIMAMLERDRETNILIKGLQEALLPLSTSRDKPKSRRLEVKSTSEGDSVDACTGPAVVDKDKHTSADYEV